MICANMETFFKKRDYIADKDALGNWYLFNSLLKFLLQCTGVILDNEVYC